MCKNPSDNDDARHDSLRAVRACDAIVFKSLGLFSISISAAAGPLWPEAGAKVTEAIDQQVARYPLRTAEDRLLAFVLSALKAPVG